MTAPREVAGVRMSDAELERVFELPPGYMACAPAAMLASLEAVRQESERLVLERVRELIEGGSDGVKPVGLMAFIEAASPAPLLPYQRDFLAAVAAGPTRFSWPDRRGKSRLASEIKRLAAGLTPRDVHTLPAAQS